MSDVNTAVEVVSEMNVEGAGESLFASAEFWVFAAFVIVVVLMFKKAKAGFISAMRLHAEKVKDKLSEARSVRNDIQSELVKTQKKLKNMQNEIASMIEKTRENSIAYKNTVQRDYMKSLHFREEKLRERIRLDEEEFQRRIRMKMIDKSFEALGLLLEKNSADDGVLIHNTIIDFAEVLQQTKKN